MLVNVNSDFSDLLSAFNDAGVEYLVVGAHALAAHGIVRATKDLDVWVRPSPDNAARVMVALAAFGAPLREVTAADFAQPGTIYQMGVAPIRIDVLTAIDGVQFDDAWPARVVTSYGDRPAFVLSRRDFLQNKRTCARPQDLADVAALEAIK